MCLVDLYFFLIGTQGIDRLPAMHAKRTSVPFIPPAPVTLDRVTGQLTAYTGVVVTRPGMPHEGGDVWHPRGGSQLPYPSELE